MELDELKNIWDEANTTAAKKQILNHQTIEKMTQIKVKSRLSKIVNRELAGTIMCMAGAAYIGLNFGKLNTTFYQAMGIVTILFLVGLPLISLRLLWQMNIIIDIHLPYAETLKHFARQKIRFVRFQQASIAIAYLLFICVIFLMPQLTEGRTINPNSYFWLIPIAFGCTLLYFFSKTILRSYKNTLQQAEELLKEIEA